MTGAAGVRGRHGQHARALLAVATVIAATAGAGLALAGPASARGGVSVTATINGAKVAGSSTNHPVRLSPARPADLSLTVTNNGSQPVSVRTVRLQGSVLGLSFYSFDTSVAFDVPAGQTTNFTYELDVSELRGQATGLIPGSVELLDGQHHQIASQAMVSDVRGSLASVYGLFGLALLVLTLFAIADVLLAVARHRMPANRWRRALRFLTPGIGIGLILVFTMSALRVWVPRAGTWLTVVAIGAVVFFAAGYLSPTPASADDDDDEADDGAEENDEARPTLSSPTLPGTGFQPLAPT